MGTPNPATPANAATPGNVQQVAGTPSPVTPAIVTPTGQGYQAEGSVTIPTKEYAQLQRDHARVVGFENRARFLSKNKPNNIDSNNQSGDPEVNAELQRTQDANAELRTRAFRAEVTLKVRDVLDKPEFANLHPSTKALILKNPAMLSNADTVEEAMFDIADFVREQIISIPVQSIQQNNQGDGSRANNTPTGHDTPPVVGGGSPAHVNGVEMEDFSKLTGPARSRAILRNSIKMKGRK